MRTALANLCAGTAAPAGRRAALAACAGALLALAGAPGARAQPAPDDPRDFILRLRADVLAAGAPERPRGEARAALEQVVAAAFDLAAIAQAALRPAGERASADQRDRLARALARRMGGALDRRAGAAAYGFRIAALRETAAGEWTVVSQVTPPDAPAGAPPGVFAWRVRRVDGRLRVVDVVRDGVSAVIVQRDEIAAALAAGRSLDAVIADIERR